MLLPLLRAVLLLLLLLAEWRWTGGVRPADQTASCQYSGVAFYFVRRSGGDGRYDKYANKTENGVRIVTFVRDDDRPGIRDSVPRCVLDIQYGALPTVPPLHKAHGR